MREPGLSHIVPTFIFRALVPGLVVALLLPAVPAESGQTAVKCQANKLKTAAKHGRCLFRVLSKAAKKEAAEADYTACDAKFATKWLKIVAAGGCAATDDLAVAAATVAAHIEAATTVSPTTDVSVEGLHSCAGGSSGAVQCWGFDLQGQASPPAGVFNQVSAGSVHTCAINSVGAVECWGLDANGQSSPPAGVFTQVSAGGLPTTDHTCAIRDAGAVECWGFDDVGQAESAYGQLHAGLGRLVTHLRD